METAQQTPGVVITLDTIYETVKDVPALIADMGDMKTDMKAVNIEIGKLKSQLSAQWVVVGIIIAAIGSQASKLLGG